jgi:hypothetical protein
MESLEAFRDTPSKKKAAETEPKAAVIEYEPMPVLERYQVGENTVELDGTNRIVTITGECGSLMLSYAEVPDLTQFLAWAMRRRMEVTADAQTEQIP